MKRIKKQFIIFLSTLLLVCNFNVIGFAASETQDNSDNEEPEYSCGKEEHTHSDECYETTLILICENESEDHEHDDSCYSEEKVLICEKEEHEHTEECIKEDEKEADEEGSNGSEDADKDSETKKGETDSAEENKSGSDSVKENESEDAEKEDQNEEPSSEKDSDADQEKNSDEEDARAEDEKADKDDEEEEKEEEDPFEPLIKYFEATYDTKLQYPLIRKGSYTYRFGSTESLHPRGHKGLDISIGFGTEVLAAEEGVIKTAHAWDGTLNGMNGYGNYVDIDHGNGIVTRYAHLSQINVAEGDKVKRGQQIGRVGSTGHSIGPHLHFEVIIKGTQVNPEPFIGELGTSILNIDYSSKRLIVETENENLLKDAPVLGSFGNTYLVQYDTEEQARVAYIKFFAAGASIEVDYKFSLAVAPKVDSEDDEAAEPADDQEKTDLENEDAGDPEETSGVLAMTEDENPYDKLAAAFEDTDSETDDLDGENAEVLNEDDSLTPTSVPIIAILDTGVGAKEDFEEPSEEFFNGIGEQLASGDVTVKDAAIEVREALNPYPNLVDNVSLVPIIDDEQSGGSDEDSDNSHSDSTDDSDSDIDADDSDSNGEADGEDNDADNSDESAEDATIVYDLNGHGTATYDAILEEAPDARILSIQVADENGNSDFATVYAGILYALEYSADYIVIPVLAENKDGSELIARTVQLANYVEEPMADDVDEDQAQDSVDASSDSENADDQRYVTFITAAGDYGVDAEIYAPANIEGIIAVGASDKYGNRLETSNYGQAVNNNVCAEDSSEAAARMAGIMYANDIRFDNIKDLTLNQGKVFDVDYEPPEIQAPVMSALTAIPEME